MKRFLEKCLICTLLMTVMSNFIMSIPVSFAYAKKPEILAGNIVVKGEKKDFYQAVSADDRQGTGSSNSNASTSYAPGQQLQQEQEQETTTTTTTTTTSSSDGGSFLGGLFSGLVGLLTWIPRALLMAIAWGVNGFVTALVVIGGGKVDEVKGASGDDNFFVTPFHVFFNKIPILDVNFLDLEPDSGNTTVKIFRQAVAGWYYSMRLIATMVLLVILIYIGIRMAISTIASEKAMYKKMLVDWVTSLVLLFLLHYIMIFTFGCNDALVSAMAGLAENTDMTVFMSNLRTKALDPFDAVLSFAAIIVYSLVIFQTLSFVLAYIKRMLTIGFLIIIAPLITITYSIDKIGDGKAQALNTWLKEFVYNILIQPFHCILFLSFAKVALDLLAGNSSGDDASIATAVLAILCIQYIKTGEELVKEIFGFKKAGSLSTLAAGAALSMAAISKGGAAGKAVGGMAAKGVRLAKKGVRKAPGALNKVKNSKLGKGVGKLTSGATNAVKNSALGMAVAGATSGFMADMKRKKESRKEEKIQKQMEKNLGTERYNKLVAGQDTAEGKQAYDQARQQAANQVAEKSNRGQKITGATSKAGRYVANVGSKIVNSDVGKFVQKNSGKIAGVMFGTILGAAGLANGGAGMVAGYKVGSGLAQGYLANSGGTIKKDLNGLVQASANMDGQGNTEDKMLLVQAIGDSEGYKDLGKKLDELKNQLSKLGMSNNQSQLAWGNIHRQLTLDPSSVNEGSIRRILGQSSDFNNLSPDKQDAAVELMKNHTNLMAQASLYNSMKNAQGLGFDISEMAGMVGNKTPVQGSSSTSGTQNTQTTETVETAPVEVDTTQVEIDVQDFTEKLRRELKNHLQGIPSSVDINNLINQLKMAKPEQQTAVLQTISMERGYGPDWKIEELEQLIRNNSNN